MHPTLELPKTRAQNLNTDLRLINAYLRDAFQPELRPRNINHLNSLLKDRLHRAPVSTDQKQRCQEWLTLKSTEVGSAIQTVRQKARESKKKQEKEYAISNVVQPTLFEQYQFFQRSFDYSFGCMLQHIASSQVGRKHLFRTMLGRLNLSSSQSSGAIRTSPPRRQEGVRNQAKREKYLALTGRLVKQKKFEDNDSICYLAQSFAQSIDHPLWHILHLQLQNISQNDVNGPRDSLLQKLITNSLFAVEQQFSDQLPKSNEGLSSYLQRKYLSRIDPTEYVMDPQFGCLWGKAFLLLRAGRIKQVLRLFQRYQCQELYLAIDQSYKSIRRYKPERIEVRLESSKDIFLEQIQFALCGERKYSSNAISQIYSLDPIWILLRNTGVFYETEADLYDEMKMQMSNFYVQHCTPLEITHFLAYLLDYQAILRIGQSQAIDNDDYIHFLLVLSRYPFLAQQKIVHQRLTTAIASYLLQFHEKQADFIEYYVSLVPFHHMAQVIAKSRLYSRIKWQAMFDLLGEIKFMEVLQKATQTEVKETKRFREGAELIMRWVVHKYYSPLYYKLPVQLLLSHLIAMAKVSFSSNEDEAISTIKLIHQLTADEPNLQREYSCLAQFMDINRKLTVLLTNRNYLGLQSLMERESHNIFFTTIDYIRGKMLEKLAILGGTEVYFLFLGNLLHIADLLFTFQQRLTQRTNLRFQVLKLYKLILGHEKLGKMYSGPHATDLLLKLERDIAFQ